MDMEREKMFWTKTLNEILDREKGFAYMLAMGTSELSDSLNFYNYNGDGFKIRCGASKMCILVDGHDTVLKIPFDFDGDDYCALEADNFKDAVDEKLEKFFCATERLMVFPFHRELEIPWDEETQCSDCDGWLIEKMLDEEAERDFDTKMEFYSMSIQCYVAPKLEIGFDTAIDSDVYKSADALSEEKIDKVLDERDCCVNAGLYERDVRVALMFQMHYGTTETEALNAFLLEHDINDLHTSNIMFDKNFVPYIIDYSGYHG